ncbi:hypothetical protein L7F22_042070 [Adiantum nelumboides]|nr:hypothetical protein [Adiantum nelumboides]
MKPVLTPIIYCGPGANLYPLCDDLASPPPSSVVGGSIEISSSKALLPLANRPMLAFALQSIFSAGLSNCIILAHSSQHAAIIRALSSIKLIAPPNLAFLTDNKRRPKETKDHDRSTQGQITFIDPTLPGSPALPTSNVASSSTGANAASTTTTSSSNAANGSMRVELLPLGPYDGNTGVNKSPNEIQKNFRRGPLGTAELLRWIASIGKLDSDPLILPVDLVAPAFPLRDLIDAYVQSQALSPRMPTACCALYERGAGEGVGKEREKEGPPRLISAYAPDQAEHRLVFLQDSDLSEDLSIRRSLLEEMPQTRISTRLLDAHAYIFNKQQLLPLLESNPKLTSLRDHVLPLIAKASWMKGLREKANWHLPGDQDDVSDDALMDTTEDLAVADLNGTLLHEEVIGRNSNGRKDSKHNEQIRCLAVIVRLDSTTSNGGEVSSSTLPRFIARANTVATYLESNRWLLRQSQEDQSAFVMPDIIESSIQPITESVEGTPNIAPSAQISQDSILGAHVRVGERASIKRSTIGHHCEIGRGARLSGCILMDGAKVGENVRLENVICCASSVLGDRCTLKDCDVAPGVNVAAETNVKNEKLVGEYEEEDEDDEEEA